MLEFQSYDGIPAFVASRDHRSRPLRVAWDGWFRGNGAAVWLLAEAGRRSIDAQIGGISEPMGRVRCLANPGNRTGGIDVLSEEERLFP